MKQPNQNSTPLFTKLKEYANSNPLPFHIPGHKKGQGMDTEFRQFIGENALSIDLINIEPLDDLHQPQGIIHEAQQLAAEAFGAKRTFFSVQGTSTAIMAMILATCNPGDKIIVPRTVHKSVSSAIVLADCNPVFLHPELDPKLGIAHGITPEQVEEALHDHPDAKAVLVINPNYFGFASNLQEIVHIAHKKQIPVLVDEAHGVHTHFHSELPISAMDAGADLAATSVHKLGGSLTQSSVLNLQGDLVDPRHVQSILSMLTTTSTSYILLASLDTARRYLAIHGEQAITDTLVLARKARKQINEIDGLLCVGKEWLDEKARYDLDETKLLIHVGDLSINGHEASDWLRETHQIEVEMSDLYNILCFVTLGDNDESISSLIDGLKDLAAHFQTDQSNNTKNIILPDVPELVVSPRTAFYSDTESIPFRQAAGQIIAEFLFMYPPGIPILLPGERITEENIAYIEENKAAGLIVQGTEDPLVEMVKVIRPKIISRRIHRD
jgi:arginine/lysine/ornithine decarboxylase